MNIERHHLIEAIDSAIRKLSAAAVGQYTVPTPRIWEVIGDLELTSNLAKAQGEKGENHGAEERREVERT